MSHIPIHQPSFPLPPSPSSSPSTKIKTTYQSQHQTPNRPPPSLKLRLNEILSPDIRHIEVFDEVRRRYVPDEEEQGDWQGGGEEGVECCVGFEKLVMGVDWRGAGHRGLVDLLTDSLMWAIGWLVCVVVWRLGRIRGSAELR